MQPIAASSPVARKRPSSDGEGPPAEDPVGDRGFGAGGEPGSSAWEDGMCREGPTLCAALWL